MAGVALAQSSDAGKFLSVIGDVRVISRDGAPRAAQREAEFREGESIITGAGALAQLRMFDGALMSVRGDTEIKLDRFSYTGEQDRNASFFMSVFKGGLRTITGVIGRQNRDRYRITTATVTLGVRGTDFEIVHVPPQAASREVLAGTYNRVFEGVTSMQNKAGVMLLVTRDQTAFAALQGTTPPVLVAPPAALFGRPTPIPQVTRPGSAATPIEAPRTASPALVTPIDAPRTLSPATATPIEAPRAVSPSLTPIQTAPVLTSPVLTPIEAAPATALTPIQTAPVLSSPALTPTTTTATPIQTAPILTSPSLTPIQTAPVPTSPAATPIQTAPVLTSPVVTPILTAPPVKAITPIVTPIIMNP
jgi:hypothetical protein